MKPYRTNRSRAYYRYQRERVIQRKWEILQQLKLQGDPVIPKGQLSKGKIHCSCMLCAVKTKKDGYRHSERKKLCSMQVQFEE